MLFFLFMNISAFYSKDVVDEPIAIRLVSLIFGECYEEAGLSMMNIVLCLAPIIIFILLFSNVAVKSEELENTYVFLRYTSRKRWCRHAFGKMGLGVLGFSILYVAAYLWMATYTSTESADIDSIKIAIKVVVILFLYINLHCMIANFIRACMKEETVFVVVVIGILCECGVLSLFPSLEQVRINLLNPMYYLMRVGEMDNAHVWIGGIYLMLLTFVTWGIGTAKVRKIDIGIRR